MPRCIRPRYHRAPRYWPRWPEFRRYAALTCRLEITGCVSGQLFNYPASTDFPTAVDGITDAGTHVEHTAVTCPKTRMVLGGYSQGAAVMGFVTESAVPDGVHLVQALQPMPSEVSNHVSAVALFGKPSTQFMSIINQPPVTIGPLYAPKTIELCVPGDPVCSGAGNPAAHRQYVEAGMVDQAADFAASRLSVGS